MTADEFVDILEEQQLLPKALTDKLREKASGPKGASAKALAKFLVDKGHLTKHQAATVLSTEPVPQDVLTPVDDEPEESPDPSLSGLPDLGSPLDALGDLGDAGGGGGLGSDPLATGGGLEAEAKPKKKDKKKKKSNKKANEWDSPLLLIGGGSLLLVVVITAVMIVILRWESGDKLIASAREARDSGSYSNAIASYERFVEKFTSHEEFSAARVELAMVRIRRAVEGNSFDSAMTIATSELKVIDNEEAFSEAEEELTQLLPAIALGLADAADNAEPGDATQVLVEQATAALALCQNNRYIPTTLRDETEMNQIRETLSRIERRQQSLASLNAAIATIDEAIAAGDTRAAYAARDELASNSPELSDDPRLAEAIERISQAERTGVAFVQESIAAVTEERATPIISTLVVANNRIAGSSPASGSYVVIVGDVAYGLNAADGLVQWRRYLGPQTKFIDPVMLGDDVILVDTAQGEVLRLNSSSGKLVWRLPLSETVSQPVIAGDKILIASEAAKLHVVSADTGERTGYVQFAQPLTVSPAVDLRGRRVYATGYHSSIYTLNLDSFECLGVFFSGHEAGTISTSARLALNKLVVIENDGIQSCLLRVLGLDSEGIIQKELASDRPSTGLVVQAPTVSGRRVVVVTDRGGLTAYDVNPGNDDQALVKLADQRGPEGEPFPRYVALDERNVWFASSILAKLVVAPTGNRLLAQQIANEYPQSIFAGPPILRNGVLLHLRQSSDRASLTATATDTQQGRTLWETDLGAPPAGGVLSISSPPGLLLSDANGKVFRFDAGAIRAGVQSKALDASEAALPPLDLGVLLPDGSAVFGSTGSNKVLLASDSLQDIELDGELSSPPTSFGDGWLAALTNGQVHYLAAGTGKKLAGAFQPPLPPGSSKAWLPIATVAGDQPQFVLSDGIEKIYLVGLGDGKAYLQAIGEAAVGTSALKTRLATAGSRVFAGSVEGRLVSFSLPSLEPAEQLALGGTVVWGPYSIGDAIVLATSTGEIVSIGGDGQEKWRSKIAFDDFAGPPTRIDGSLILVSQSGVIVRLSIGDGSIAGTVETGQPLWGAAATLQSKLVVASSDGSILVVDQPK